MTEDEPLIHNLTARLTGPVVGTRLGISLHRAFWAEADELGIPGSTLLRRILTERYFPATAEALDEGE